MKRKTILKHADFLTQRDGLYGRCECFVVKTKPVKISGDPRYGVIAPKKTFKLAIDRNRAKRLLRDWIAFNENLMHPDLDYIFIAYAGILDVPRDIGRQNMCKVLKRIARLYKSHEKQK